jgi:hypothetical protein
MSFWKRMLARDGYAETPGAAARRQHSAFLTEALATGRTYPRIPMKPVEKGGFAKLLSLENGARLAAKWWELALARFD